MYIITYLRLLLYSHIYSDGIRIVCWAYFAYVSGACNANLFLYSVSFIAYCYILYDLYYIDIGNVLCVYFLLLVDHQTSSSFILSHYALKKIETNPAALRYYSTVVTLSYSKKSGSQLLLINASRVLHRPLPEMALV